MARSYARENHSPDHPDRDRERRDRGGIDRRSRGNLEERPCHSTRHRDERRARDLSLRVCHRRRKRCGEWSHPRSDLGRRYSHSDAGIPPNSTHAEFSSIAPGFLVGNAIIPTPNPQTGGTSDYVRPSPGLLPEDGVRLISGSWPSPISCR